MRGASDLYHAHRCAEAQASVAPRSSSERRQRLAFIEALRALAIIIVVATHVRDPFPPDGLVKSDDFGIIFRHINLIFIFVSGYLFQYLIGRFEYGRYLKTKLRNVAAPYLVMSIPAIAIYLAGLKAIDGPALAVADQGLWTQVGVMLLTGSHLAPFWFIPMMALFYLAAPLLARIDRTPWFYLLIIPFLALSLWLGRSPVDANPAQNFVFYGPVYLAGMAMSHFQPWVARVPVALWVLLTLCLFLPFLGPPASDPRQDDLLFVTKITFCLGVTGLMQRYVTRVPSWLRYVGDISFGIFFVHYYAIASITQLVQREFFGGRLAGFSLYLVACAIVFTASVAAVTLIKRVAGARSRLIVGA